MQIGFIGLGNMGAAIAANLLHARHDVALWNRTAAKARPLVNAGATLAASPRAALRVPMPLLSLLRDHLLQTIAQQGEDVDWAAIARTAATNAAL